MLMEHAHQMTTISLGRADVFNLVAVFDSEGASTDATMLQNFTTSRSGGNIYQR